MQMYEETTVHIRAQGKLQIQATKFKRLYFCASQEKLHCRQIQPADHSAYDLHSKAVFQPAVTETSMSGTVCREPRDASALLSPSLQPDSTSVGRGFSPNREAPSHIAALRRDTPTPSSLGDLVLAWTKPQPRVQPI